MAEIFQHWHPSGGGILHIEVKSIRVDPLDTREPWPLGCPPAALRMAQEAFLSLIASLSSWMALAMA